MVQLFANNATSTLNGAISNSATTINLQSGDGAKFPSPTGSDYFLVTLIGKTGGIETSWEICKCTARTTDALTVVRGQEGTTAGTWADTTPVELRLTAAQAGNFPQKDAANAFTARQTIPASQSVIVNKGTVGTGTVTFDGSLADYQRLQVSGALTIAFSNMPSAGTTEGVVIELVNGGSAAVTFPTSIYIKSDGSTSATFADMGVTLQTSGTNWLVYWLNTAGSLCCKVVR